MTALRTGLLAIGVAALAAPLYAADPAASRVGELRTAQQRVARAASATKGGAQHRLLQEQQKLRRDEPTL